MSLTAILGMYTLMSNKQYYDAITSGIITNTEGINSTYKAPPFSTSIYSVLLLPGCCCDCTDLGLKMYVIGSRVPGFTACTVLMCVVCIVYTLTVLTESSRVWWLSLPDAQMAPPNYPHWILWYCPIEHLLSVCFDWLTHAVALCGLWSWIN